VRSRSRQRAATLTTFFSHGLLFASWAAHIPGVKAHLGLSDAALGSVLLCTPVGSVCAMMLIGRLLPKLGSRQLVRISLVGYCAAGPLVGLAADPLELAGTLFAWGAFQGALDVSMNTQAVAVEKVQMRPLMSTFHGAWSIGALNGAALGAAAVAAHLTPGSQHPDRSDNYDPCVLFNCCDVDSNSQRRSGASSDHRSHRTGFSPTIMPGEPLFCSEKHSPRRCCGTWCRSQCRWDGVRRMLPRESERGVQRRPPATKPSPA